jgi:uncharacterized protein YggE
MRSLWLGILLATVKSLAFGQLDSDTLTVSVSQSVNLQPDQIVFGITQIAPPDRSLNEVLATLKAAGITQANFSTVSSVPGSPNLQWLFTVAVPLSKMRATSAQLTAQKISFSVEGLQVSDELQRAQQCSIPSMFADIGTQAKNIADAAGLAVGDVLAISQENAQGKFQASYGSISAAPDATFAISRYAWFTTPLPAPVNCFLTVQFKLLRYHN